MAAHKIPAKVRAAVDRIYEGEARTRVVKALEAGKTVYHGALKLKADKVEKAAVAEKTTAAFSAPAKADAKTDAKETK